MLSLCPLDSLLCHIKYLSFLLVLLVAYLQAYRDTFIIIIVIIIIIIIIVLLFDQETDYVS